MLSEAKKARKVYQRPCDCFCAELGGIDCWVFFFRENFGLLDVDLKGFFCHVSRYL